MYLDGIRLLSWKTGIHINGHSIKCVSTAFGCANQPHERVANSPQDFEKVTAVKFALFNRRRIQIDMINVPGRARENPTYLVCDWFVMRGSIG
jgi:hypothetical protein